MSTATAPVPEAATSPDAAAAPERFTTFAGVLRPVLLTILGAMLYLREGWLVGGTGLFGALLVIAAAYVITGTTSLSLSSIATNVRVRPGGAFAIIAQALGLEAGGSIGIPLFIAQSASAAMYLYAFTEGWNYLFPTHDPRAVVAIAYLAVAVFSWASASLAFRAQAVMLVVIVVAVTSAFLGVFTHERVSPTWFRGSPEVTLGAAFAIFFPAATGIMVGVGMSGSLADPRKSIPRGTLGAWGISLAVYVAAAFWYASIASPEELVADKTIMMKKALVGPLVLVGLLCSTSMAALSTLVAAPRLLQAMAAQRVVPAGEWLSRETATGDPRNASLATLALSGLFLLSGSLDAIAPIVTSFFILTYLAVNLVVFLEQQLGMISFRPTFGIPTLVPFVGVVACLFGLIASSPGGGVVEIAFVAGIYVWLQRRQLHTPWETVRSGISSNLAAWAARRSLGVEQSERAWKPDLLVPVETIEEARSVRPLIAALARFNGSAKLVAMRRDPELIEELAAIGTAFRGADLYTTWTTVDAPDFATGTIMSVDALQGAFFPPNMVLLDASQRRDADMQPVLDHCDRLGVGLVVYVPPEDGILGQTHEVVVWLSDRSPDWSLHLHNANLDLLVLIGYLLVRSHQGARLRLATVIRDGDQRDAAAGFLQAVVDQGRLPRGTATEVLEGDFLTLVRAAGAADVHLFGLPDRIDHARLLQIRNAAHGACLFLRDSGKESLLA